jgi:hypothetical protein
MNQHSIQRAFYDQFCDRGMVWVYPKDGGRTIRKPTSWCTTESDFQSVELEQAQANDIESPGIVALRNILEERTITDADYHFVTQWCALHILRNKRMRNNFPDYQNQFPVEFTREVEFSESFFKFMSVYTCTGSNFFITSDHPVVEFPCDGHKIRLLLISPQKLVQFAPVKGKFSHGEGIFEDVVNAMTWGHALNHVYSHRGDVDTARLQSIADQRNVTTSRLETETVILKHNPFPS